VSETQKRERENLARALRAQGATWVEIAEEIRLRYRVNARVALRLAHGWSQGKAAEEWNKRWPDDLKTNKHFSYWEMWPARTGYTPSLTVLTRMSELYACRVSDLVVDLADNRHQDNANTVLSGIISDAPATHTGEVAAASQAEILFLDLLNQPGFRHRNALASFASPRNATLLVQRIREVDLDELVRVIVMWAQQWNPAIGRRGVLAKLSTALVVAAAAPLFDVLDPDEQKHVARVLSADSPEFDETALRYCEGMVTNLCRQIDVLGPRLSLQSVLGHRQIASQLAKIAPAEFQQRAISVYAEFSRLMGWLCFNMSDLDSGAHYYEDARSAAHDAQNVELVSYVLCAMSQLATWRGKPRIGIDHAAAAAVWAEQTDSPHARAYAADVAVRAYLADNQPGRCRTALDLQYAALKAVSSDAPISRWWYAYDETGYWSTYTQFALKFEKPEDTIAAVDKSLALVDPANLHERAHRSLFRAEARIQQDAIAEACTIIGDIAQLTAVSQPQRVNQRIDTLRKTLTPWERTKTVRELDERLDAYRRASDSGSTKIL
jgi:hypothetical protein